MVDPLPALSLTTSIQTSASMLRGSRELQTDPTPVSGAAHSEVCGWQAGLLPVSPAS